MSSGQFSSPWRALAERVLDEYRAALSDDLVAVACFGSAVRGQHTLESDLDLYVVVRDQTADASGRCAERLDAIRTSSEYGGLVRRGYHPDPMPIIHSVSKLATHPWILLDIQDHGVILFDPEGVLTTEFEAVRARLQELGSRRIVRPDGTWYWDLKPDWRPGEVFSL